MTPELDLIHNVMAFIYPKDLLIFRNMFWKLGATVKGYTYTLIGKCANLCLRGVKLDEVASDLFEDSSSPSSLKKTSSLKKISINSNTPSPNKVKSSIDMY